MTRDEVFHRFADIVNVELEADPLYWFFAEMDAFKEARGLNRLLRDVLGDQ